MNPAPVIRIAGDWSSDAVKADWVDGSLVPSEPVRSLIQSAWSAALAVPNRTLFDGPMCRLESFDVSAPGVRIGMSRTSYKAFWGTNMSHPELVDQFGPNVLANPIGLSPALRTADGWLVLGRRNERVAYYPGRVHPFSGCLEPGDGTVAQANGGSAEAPDVFAAVRRELGEELHLSPDDLTDLRLTGLAEDPRLRQPELIFRVQTRRTREQLQSQLDPAEHREIVAIEATPNAVAAAIRDHTAGGLTPIAVATLLLWGRVVLGVEWFDATAAGVARTAS